ncbi:MAG: glycosyltransferase family 4 protein [Sarcina sp.]
MKKILFFHHASILGGGTKSAVDIIEMLSEEYEIKGVISTVKNETKNLFDEKKFDYLEYEDNFGVLPWYKGGPSLFSRTFWYCLYKTFKFRKYIDTVIGEEKPDIVILNSIVLSWIGPILKRKNVKGICFVREAKKGGVISRVQEKFLLSFSRVCFISEYDQNQYTKKINSTIIRDCAKIETFNNIDIVNSYEIDTSKFNILYLGGDSDLKGWNVIKQLVKDEVWEKKYIENIKFLMLGDFKIKEFNTTCNIEYLGCITDIEKIYKFASIIIMPITKGHQLRPIIEAGMAKCPVIVTFFEELQENIKENETCLTIKNNDVKELKEKILLIYNNSDFAEELVKKNYEFIREKYEYQLVRKKLQDFLEELK